MRKENNERFILKPKVVRCAVRVLAGVVASVLTVSVNGCKGYGQEESVSLEVLLSKQEETSLPAADADETASDVKSEADVPKVDSGKTNDAEGKQPVVETVWVHVCGAVAMPGIYELPAHSRLYDALVAAGGFTGKADTTYYNLASFVSDGMQIEVPCKEENIAGKAAGQSVAGTVGTSAQGHNASGQALGETTQKEQEDVRININTASAEELQKLPGIGESRARDIILYRQKHGDFTDISGIMEVSGIKDAIFEKIKDLIKVE